ncbi:hypothetical protein [Paenibacillus odorifer]|uniref:hypothetical protein n=1 Tax=Paenibacillus odorifer TaxID=189426 RepID=UPI00096E9D37|nr:hypothetical protein [Paenibacillus odorifer]OME23387.1 hypothetical protein BSK57_16375 [Paenibacillus odorifer]
MNSDVLIESVSLRNSYTSRVDVLNKVKGLSLLPDNENVSMEMAGEYYEVPKQTINSLIFDNREELENDGLKVMSGNELIFFKELGVIGKNSSSFTVIPRRALLRIGMLLRDSLVARAVRDYLLDTEDSQPKQLSQSELIAYLAQKNVEHERAEAERKRADAERDRRLNDMEEKWEDTIEVMALNPGEDWRKETTAILNKIAQGRGGGEAYQGVRNESYELLTSRFGPRLEVRKQNMQGRMLREGATPSKVENLSKLDVIAADRRLINDYITVVKDMAIKYNVKLGGR